MKSNSKKYGIETYKEKMKNVRSKTLHTSVSNQQPLVNKLDTLTPNPPSIMDVAAH
jgi:hypothetical protein